MLLRVEGDAAAAAGQALLLRLIYRRQCWCCSTLARLQQDFVAVYKLEQSSDTNYNKAVCLTNKVCSKVKSNEILLQPRERAAAPALPTVD